MPKTNVAYYAAEEALRAEFQNMNEETLRRRLCEISKVETCAINRLLFYYFGVKEHTDD
jgi:hypothetical protein